MRARLDFPPALNLDGCGASNLRIRRPGGTWAVSYLAWWRWDGIQGKEGSGYVSVLAGSTVGKLADKEFGLTGRGGATTIGGSLPS